MQIPEAPKIAAGNIVGWFLVGVVVLTVAVVGHVITSTQAGHVIAQTLAVTWEFIKALGSVIKAAWLDLRAANRQ